MTNRSPDLSAAEAVQALHEIRRTREALNHRAAGMSLMMWALVLTSAAGSLAALAVLSKTADGTGIQYGWELYVIAFVSIVLLWALVGILVHNTIWASFHAPATRPGGWRAPLAALGSIAAVFWLNASAQSLTRWMQGLDGTSAYADLEHNLGFAMAMGIGAAFVVAITVLMGFRGFQKAPGLAIGGGMFLCGQLATFLWVPELGLSGVLLAASVIPLTLLGLGYHTWRRG